MPEIVVDTDTIKKLIEQGSSTMHVSLLAQHVCDTLIDIDRVRTKLEELEREKEAITDDYNQKIKEIHSLCNGVRLSCPHHFVTYYPDPSGNNDTSNTCDCCGAEVPRHTRKS